MGRIEFYNVIYLSDTFPQDNGQKIVYQSETQQIRAASQEEAEIKAATLITEKRSKIELIPNRVKNSLMQRFLPIKFLISPKLQEDPEYVQLNFMKQLFED